MSSSTIRKMKILALPLTAKTPKRDALTYYHFITRTPAPPSQQGYVGKAQAKAASIWAGFGKAESGWKQKVFTFGEKAFDRLEYEEISLSGLDPTLGPKLRKFGSSPEVVMDGTTSTSGEKASTTIDSDRTPIALVHPTFASADPEDHLRRLIEHRSPKHKRGALTWAIVAPFTAPFAIIPIIPNLPFFFCVWRAWTHYKAFRASDYLAALFKRGAIASEPSTELDEIYARHGVSLGKDFGTTKLGPSVSQSSQPAESESHPLLDRTGAREGRQPGPLLLSRSAVPEILRLFELPDGAGGEIYRSIEQARQRTADGSRSSSDVEK